MDNSVNIDKNTNKIPKIIHYCWFGGKPIPNELQKCLETWKKLKGYEIKRWDESNCTFDENDFVKRTHESGQLGFIGDYYRLKAVYEWGGIYLDTDVKTYKSFDNLLKNNCFFGFIFDCSVGTAVFGAEPHNKFIKKLLDIYDNMVFENGKSGKVLENREGKIVASMITTSNYVWTWCILNEYPEFKLNNTFQNLGDFVIFPKEYFEIGMLNGKHYAIHLNSGAWRKKSAPNKRVELIKDLLAHFPFLYDKVQIIVRKRRYKRLNKSIPFYDISINQKMENK